MPFIRNNLGPTGSTIFISAIHAAIAYKTIDLADKRSQTDPGKRYNPFLFLILPMALGLPSFIDDNNSYITRITSLSLVLTSMVACSVSCNLDIQAKNNLRDLDDKIDNVEKSNAKINNQDDTENIIARNAYVNQWRYKESGIWQEPWGNSFLSSPEYRTRKKNIQESLKHFNESHVARITVSSSGDTLIRYP